jgi:hypothetical protein
MTKGDDKRYVVYCFANPQHAKAFAAIFNGEPFNPALIPAISF